MRITPLILILLLLTACNAPRKTEGTTEEVTEASLDSVIVHYLDKLDSGENMPEVTKEEYNVLILMEQKLVEQLNDCLEGNDLDEFKAREQDYLLQWERQKDSVINVNEDVTFEEGLEMKEMFLTWQYTYLKELRIIELIRLRDQNCD